MKNNVNLIKYNNDLQSIKITSLTTWEFKIWMYILLNVKNKQEQEVVITFEDIRNKIGITKNNEKIYQLLKSTSNKLISQNITFINKDDTEFTQFNFFDEFRADKKNGLLKIQVNKKFLYIVNELIKNYSVLNWEDVKVLKSKYSLQMYKLIREFKQQEYLEFTIDKFKSIFNLKNKAARYINDKVLIPIQKELPLVIKEFKLERIKDYKTAPIKKIKLTWKYLEKDYFYINEYKFLDD